MIKDEFYDIIPCKIRWDYMNNNILISTAMLNSFLKTQQKDTFDIIMPFLKYSISKTATQNVAIDISKITDYLNTEFGYETMPHNVVSLMLKRLVKKGQIECKNHSFFLTLKFNSGINNFEQERLKCIENNEKVINSLIDFAQTTYGFKWDENSASQHLIKFFVIQGICILKDTDALNLIKKKDSEIQFCIAQFILKSKENGNSPIFIYIENMVKGFFVSSAISLQTENRNLLLSKFKNISCYIDTTIILRALGLKTEEEKIASLELLSMLHEKGCKLLCFRHNVEEIDDIIGAYRFKLTNPYQNKSNLTLEAWDEKNFDTVDVDRYRAILESRITHLYNMRIVDTPTVSDYKSYPINYESLYDHVGSNMQYNREDRLKNDVDSIEAVCVQRNGNQATNIENCGYLFVTSNVTLVNVVTNYFRNEQKDNRLNAMFSPIISDVDLSSIVWLKCYSTHSKFPKQKLIENAICALKPDSELMDTFFEYIDKVQSDGDITEDEAAMIRIEPFCIKEMTTKVRGNKANVDKKLILHLKDYLRENYTNDLKIATVKYANGLQEEVNEKQRLYQEQKEVNIKIQDKVIEEIKDIADKSFKHKQKQLKIITTLIMIVITILFTIATILSFTLTTKYLWASIIIGLVGLISRIDFIVGKQDGIINKRIDIIATNYSNKISDKKREEYDKILK